MLSLKESGIEVSVFSDSIVISYPHENTSPLSNLLMEVIHLQLDMMSVKVMMRGGITYGKLYHSDGIVYGLAMIDAYNLESKCAIYPRVVVNGSALVAGIQCGWDGPDNEQEVINEITMRDEDGKIFVDFMSQWQETDDNNAYLVVLCTTNKTLDKLKPEYSDGLYIE